MKVFILLFCQFWFFAVLANPPLITYVDPKPRNFVYPSWGLVDQKLRKGAQPKVADFKQNFEALTGKSIEQAVKEATGKIVVIEAKGLLPDNGEQAKLVEKVTEQVFATYKKLFPEIVGNLAAPKAYLDENKIGNDTINWEGQTGLPISTGLNFKKPVFGFTLSVIALNSFKDMGDLTFVIAHEIAHLFQKISSNPFDTMQFYLASKDQEPIGNLARLTETPELRGLAQEWYFLNWDLGRNSFSNNNGVPLTLMYSYNSNSYFGSSEPYLSSILMRAIFSFSDEVCHKAANAYEELLVENFDSYSKSSFSQDLETDITTFQKFREKEIACLRGKKPTWLNLIDAKNKGDLRRIEKSLSGIFKVKYLERKKSYQAFEGDILSWLDETTIQTSERLQELANKFPPDQLRFYTIEDDADYFGARVTKYLGYDPSNAIVTILAEEKKWGMPSKTLDCLSHVQAGNVPAFGDLFDPHHETCWRLYQIKKL